MKNPKAFVLVPAAACALILAGCSSSGDTAADATATAAAPTAPQESAAPTCPSEPAPADAPVQWQLDGVTGSVSVTGQTDTTAPAITVDAPFSVDRTQVETLEPGDGPKVTGQSTVLVCYVGVDGRDGSVFDSAYQRGRPEAFPASGVVPGFQQALVGQTVGSSVAVVIPPADGYPQGTPDGAIKAGDSIVFALKIVAAR
ncbi:FKBP-type peptidyl-prolyl cis-trans isomerase [Tomitella fengzijianii]|uniref:Peptidyl-prolyl cis-trans isomerase n=1 Tax=Tomitella fengzijianii TaxID=2597660 RepID=A0A516X753_9ACTN|nr:FKBP-type peptidyl-prolyl cis-trans isomerase [Tomitella fengzijianii]QDQ98843.1 peptidylprolyl isomerase [Tomitella fengzijianii]